jgi:sarcosine oxidase subunit beta
MPPRVVVIGGGAIGASCFYHLTRRGLGEVWLVERRTLASGSTGRSAAVVETQYVDPDQVALCAWSLRLFRELERDDGLPFVHHGYLRLGHRAADLDRFQASLALQRAHGMTDAVVLEPSEVGRAVPGLRVDDLTGALFGPSDGYIDAVRYCEVLAARGRERGGQLRTATRVTAVDVEGGRVAGVRLDGERLACEVVVNAAGAWAREVGKLVGLRLPVDGYRRQIVSFEAPGPLARPVPMVIDYVPGLEEEGLYFRDDAPTRLIAGLHREVHGEGEAPANPDAFREGHDWGYAERVAGALATRYPPAAAFAVTRGWAGLYPLTPDSEPILGEAPGVAGFWNAVGGGGVGVQISPALGAIIADLVVDGRTAILPDLRPYRLDRF